MNGRYGTSNALEKWGPRLVDEFLRRELRVGDPRNPTEVVTALRQRYATDANRIDQEAAGLPVLYRPQPLLLQAPAAGDTPGSKEERRVQTDLESDLQALVESRDNREWAPEIRGWRDTLLREYSDGSASARFAQDPAMRDRGFFAVRKLGEFARVARLVGVMNLSLNCDYRRLATTLDDAANVIRILMGEALFAAGLADGGFIIQVPIVDLRQRRDALVLAVRRLSSTAELNDEGGDWGDAVAAYRRLLEELSARGASELQVYMREAQLAPVLDGLVSSVSRQDPETLRQVAATVPIEIARLRRLQVIASPLAVQLPPPAPVNPVAAALSYFVQTLQLFLDGFDNQQGSARLIDLAIPLPMAARQSDEPDRVGRRLLRELVSLRGEYALEVECFLSCCGCDQDQLRCQVKLDKVLFDIDRAIDLFAQGVGSPDLWGDDPQRPGVFSEERRASVFSVIVGNMADERCCVSSGEAMPVLSDAGRAAVDVVTAVSRLATAIGATADNGRQQAAAAALGLTSVIVASEYCGASQAIGESLLRELQARRALLVLPGPGVPSVPLQAQLDLVLSAAREQPPHVATAIRLVLNAIEGAIGDTGIVAIAGISPAATNDATGVAETIRLALPAHGALLAADTAILSARAAVRAALRAAENSAQANAARTAADQAQADANAAEAVANPQPPTPAPPALVRGALIAAADAALAAAQVARAAASLQPPAAVASNALSEILISLRDILDDPLPLDAQSRQVLITEVFEEQLRTELEWETLVASLAPRCLGPGKTNLVLAGRELLHGNPNYRVRDPRALTDAVPPPPVRQGLQQIASDVGRTAVNVGGIGADVRDLQRVAAQLQAILANLTGRRGRGGRAGAVGTPPSGPGARSQKRARKGARKRAQKRARKSSPLLVAGTARRRGPISASEDREIVQFVETLNEASGSIGELRGALAREPVRAQWTSLTSRQGASAKRLSKPLVDLVEGLLDPTRATQIDVAQARAEFQKILSRESGD